jgi:aspartyl-tRNA(Asn)/glutamyl-tRNA(Gln) amidotransferase subunit C
MDINNEMIDKLADLAKLEFTAEEKEKLKGDLSKITGFFEKLNELNTDHVEPLIFMTDEVNVLRADEVHQPITKEEALKNAPAKDSDYFRVPKFIEK